MTNKMTNKKALVYVLENMIDIPADVKEKLESMVTSLENKTSAETRKPTAKQVENDGFRELILSYLQENPNLVMTCTDIGKAIPELVGMNNQRISAIVRPLVEAGQVTKTAVKGRSVFQIAKTEEAGE